MAVAFSVGPWVGSSGLPSDGAASACHEAPGKGWAVQALGAFGFCYIILNLTVKLLHTLMYVYIYTSKDICTYTVLTYTKLLECEGCASSASKTRRKSRAATQ